MMDLKIEEIVKLAESSENINNKLLKSRVRNIKTDSRKIEKGDVFIALKGDTFDGHDFAKQTIETGAIAAIVHKKIETEIPQIIVKDTTIFLGELAKYYRSKFKVKTIAVTGSCGKTTTKDMIYRVLKTKYKVVANTGSLNNHIGVPMTVFNLKKDTQILLTEVGMNHLGEIDYLCKIVKPEIGVITNIEPVHLEGLKTMDNIAKAKFELIENLPRLGLAFLNWDNEYIRGRSKYFKIRKIKYGFSKGVDFTFDDYSSINANYTFTYKGLKIKCPLLGFHNVYNMLITCAIAEYFLMKPEEIKKAIEQFKPTGRRLKIVKSKDGYTVIDDCYNANPTAVKNAIQVLKDLKIKGKKYFVFGDMGELGVYSKYYHKLIGEYILDSDIAEVFLKGDNIKHTYSFIKKKIPAKIYDDFDSLTNELKNKLQKGDCVLVKASRFMKFENISSKLY